MKPISLSTEIIFTAVNTRCPKYKIAVNIYLLIIYMSIFDNTNLSTLNELYIENSSNYSI